MPRTGANVYKRKDGRWEGRYIKDRQPSGKAVYGYVYAHSYKEVKEKFPFMMYAPVLFVSAKTNQRMGKILETVEYVASEHAKRVSTSALNDVIGEAVMLNQPPSDKGKRLKIFYTTQAGVKPPTFVIFVNSKELMHFSYLRYLENKIREAFGFKGTSLKFIVRERKDK